MKGFVFIFDGLIFISVLSAGAKAETKSMSATKLDLGSRGQVAKVFGKDVLMSDLNPTPEQLKMTRQSYPKLSEEEVLTKARSEKLSSLIWTPIMEEFGKTHRVEPTEEEIQSFAKSMNSRLKSKDVPEISPEMGKEIYQPFVKTWKISKALYEEYGGTVIFQQANPMEPVGAYRKLLEMHEKKGDFKIYDEKLKKQFWEYYVIGHSFQVPKEEIDFSVPWWLKKSRDAAR